MENQHLGPLAGVPRVHVQRNTLPRVLRVNALALRTARVPAIGGARVEAPRRDTAVHRRRGKDIRVCRGQHVGHHGAGAAPRHKDPGAVRAVGAEGVVDHVGDGGRVRTAAVRLRRNGRDVPAGAAVGALWVNHNEAVLLGELGIGRRGVVPISCARAVVDSDDDGRVGLGSLGREGVWHIDVLLNLLEQLDTFSKGGS